MRMGVLSVIVLVIDQVGISSDKDKRNSPISTHPNRPCALTVALEWMQYQSGQSHVLRLRCGAQLRQNQPQSIRMLRLNARFAARLKEALKALVPDSTDHRGKCNRWRYGLQEDAERPRFAARRLWRSHKRNASAKNALLELTRDSYTDNLDVLSMLFKGLLCFGKCICFG